MNSDIPGGLASGSKRSGMNGHNLVDSWLPAGGFALVGLMALGVAFLMVSFQSCEAATKILWMV